MKTYIYLAIALTIAFSFGDFEGKTMVVIAIGSLVAINSLINYFLAPARG